MDDSVRQIRCANPACNRLFYLCEPAQWPDRPLVPALAGHLEQPRRAQPWMLLERRGHERLVRIEDRREETVRAIDEPLRLDRELDGLAVDPELRDLTSAQISDGDERVVALAAEVVSARGELARAQDALANLRVRYQQLLEELYLLKRRLVVAKAERLDDVAEAQLAFDKLLAETQAIEKVLDVASGAEQDDEGRREAEEPATSYGPAAYGPAEAR